MGSNQYKPDHPADIDSGIKFLQAMYDDQHEVSEFMNGFKIGLQAGINALKDIKRNQAAPNICKEFMAYWNSKDKLPSIISFAQGRRDKLATRCKSPIFRERWKEAIDKLSQSEWHTGGKDGEGWKANVKWFLLNDENYVSMLERPAKKDVAGPEIIYAPKEWGQES